MTKEEAGNLCCVLVALSAITKKDPTKTLGEICAACAEGDWVIDINGMMNRRAYTAVLDKQGWRGTWAVNGKLPGPIPLTCMVIVDGHVFALVDGVIYDNGSGRGWGRPILAFYEPPGDET